MKQRKNIHDLNDNEKELDVRSYYLKSLTLSYDQSLIFPEANSFPND